MPIFCLGGVRTISHRTFEAARAIIVVLHAVVARFTIPRKAPKVAGGAWASRARLVHIDRLVACGTTCDALEAAPLPLGLAAVGALHAPVFSRASDFCVVLGALRRAAPPRQATASRLVNLHAHVSGLDAVAPQLTDERVILGLRLPAPIGLASVDRLLLSRQLRARGGRRSLGAGRCAAFVDLATATVHELHVRRLVPGDGTEVRDGAAVACVPGHVPRVVALASVTCAGSAAEPLLALRLACVPDQAAATSSAVAQERAFGAPDQLAPHGLTALGRPLVGCGAAHVVAGAHIFVVALVASHSARCIRRAFAAGHKVREVHRPDAVRRDGAAPLAPQWVALGHPFTTWPCLGAIDATPVQRVPTHARIASRASDLAFAVNGPSASLATTDLGAFDVPDHDALVAEILDRIAAQRSSFPHPAVAARVVRAAVWAVACLTRGMARAGLGSVAARVRVRRDARWARDLLALGAFSMIEWDPAAVAANVRVLQWYTNKRGSRPPMRHVPAVLALRFAVFALQPLIRAIPEPQAPRFRRADAGAVLAAVQGGGA